MDLLDDLGAQLRALSADQPTQPGDRVPGVTRTVRRIRRTRAAVAVAAAVAVLAPAGLLVSSVQHHEATSFAHSDVLTWPDRSATSEVPIAQGALDNYVEEAGATPDHVQWLYRTHVTTPDGSAHLAAFIATFGDARVLVTSARRDDLARQAEKVGWSRTKTRLVAGHLPDHVGWYLTYNDPQSTTAANAFGNLAVLLADPGAREVAWREQPLPYAPTTGAPKEGTARSTDGAFTLLVGALTGPLEATVSSQDETASYPWSLTGAPELLRPEVPTPGDWDQHGGGAFQSDPSDEGGWATPTYSVFDTSDTVLVSCYGGGTLGLEVTGGVGEPVLTSARVACDGNTHDIRHPRGVASGTGATLRALPTQLQSIAFVAGRAR